jgi:hypothetical protein
MYPAFLLLKVCIQALQLNQTGLPSEVQIKQLTGVNFTRT